MKTMAQILEGIPETIAMKHCDRCDELHTRIDVLCEECRTRKTKARRAASLKSHRTRRRMAAVLAEQSLG